MTGDDDLRALLPDPPPAAPKPREAAIAGALARFDGGAAPVRKPRPTTRSWWKSLQNPKTGLLAAAALVVAISLPFAWQAPVPPTPAAEEQVSPGQRDAAPPTPHEIADAPAAIPAIMPPSTKAAPASIEPSPVHSNDVAAAAKPVEIAQAPPPAPRPPANRAEEPAPIVVQGRGRAISQTLQDAPVAISAVSADTLSGDDGSDVVVTATRRSKSRPIGRGNWNACTVNDPSRALSPCRKLANGAAKAVRSEADGHLADGLKHAWDGDLDKAITAFDAAIAVAPGLSAAYLNRGLAHDRQGDSEAALADLDRAVRLSPKSARAYYNRSVLLRKYGDPKRAEADEQQAINLDSRYQAILR
jgi:hypothetical protein